MAKKKSPRDATTKVMAKQEFPELPHTVTNAGHASETHWYRFADIAALMAQASPHAWLNDPSLKYVNLRIDMRDQMVLILDGSTPIRSPRLEAMLRGQK